MSLALNLDVGKSYQRHGQGGPGQGDAEGEKKELHVVSVVFQAK